MPPHFALMFISSIAGSLVQAVCGFGYGPVNMSVMPYLLPYLQAVTLSGLCGSTTSLMVVLTSWRHVNLRILLPCAVTGVLTGMAAVQISAGARDALMMHCLGAGLIVLGIYSLFFKGKIRIRPTPLNGAIAGVIAGLCSGLFAVAGPPMAIYLLDAVTDNDEYRATLDAYFCCPTVGTTFMRWRNGAFTATVVHAYLPLIAALVIGTWIGTKIFHRLNAKLLRTAVYSYLIVSGTLMLFK